MAEAHITYCVVILLEELSRNLLVASKRILTSTSASGPCQGLVMTYSEVCKRIARDPKTGVFDVSNNRIEARDRPSVSTHDISTVDVLSAPKKDASELLVPQHFPEDTSSVQGDLFIFVASESCKNWVWPLHQYFYRGISTCDLSAKKGIDDIDNVFASLMSRFRRLSQLYHHTLLDHSLRIP